MFILPLQCLYHSAHVVGKYRTMCREAWSHKENSQHLDRYPVLLGRSYSPQPGVSVCQVVKVQAKSSRGHPAPSLTDLRLPPDGGLLK